MARLAATLVALLSMLTMLPTGPLVARLAAAGTGTWAMTQPSSPDLARAGAASAFDSGRGVTVVYGGWSKGTISGDTWEYDGQTWTRRLPANSPGPLLGAAMSYVTSSGRVMLFGGVGMDGLSSTTWEWDGVNWTQRAFDGPPGRMFPGLAYDSSRSRAVLFGGVRGTCDGDGDAEDDSDCATAFQGDTWEWDGNTWTQAAPAASPSARGFISLAHDANRGRTVLFGGLDASGTRQDTWEYDGLTWRQAASGGPAARAAYGVAYDSQRKTSVLFGGCQAGANDGSTWEWSGAGWTSRPTYGNPGPRTSPTMVFDARNARTVLMGGINSSSCEPRNQPIGDTWELSIPVPGAATSLVVSSDEATIPAGAAAVRLADVPSSRLNQLAQSPSVKPYGTTPVNGTQLGSIQLGSIQLGSIQLGSIQLGSIQLGSIQLGSIQLGSIQLGSIQLGSIGRVPAGGYSLDSILLSAIPAVDWARLLEGSALAGQPLQSLTLGQVLADPTAGPVLRTRTLADIQLGQSFLRTIPLADFLVGTGPLNGVAVPAGYASWCAFLKTTSWAPAQSCSDTSAGGPAGANVDPSKNSILGLDIAGADTAAIQLGSIQLGSISNLSSQPVASFKLSNFTAIAATQLGSIQLGSIPAPNTVVDCSRVDCSPSSTTTLGDAAGLNPSAIRSNATINDLGPTVNGVRVGDIIAGLLPLSDLPWEKLSADGMQDVTPVTPAGVHYHVNFDLPCNGADLSLAVQSTLPKGFRYMAGTSTVAVGQLPAAKIAEPAGSNPPLTNAPNNLKWTSFTSVPCANQPTGTQHWSLNFQAQPGLDTGVGTTSATVTTPAISTVSGQAPVRVTPNWKPNTDPGTAPVVQPDTLVIGHIADARDVAYFRVPIPAEGSQVSFYLSHVDQGADYDLAVARPTTPSVLGSQLGSIQLGSIGLSDPTSGANMRDTSLAPETLQDVRGAQLGSIQLGSIQLGSIQLAALSQTRGNADELARLTTGPETGYYTVAISGYNGSFSNRPYVLRVKVLPPPTLPATCPARPNMNIAPAGTLLPAAAIPASTKTLFLVNQRRLNALYPSGDVATMQGSLTAVAGRSEVAGQILNVDGDPGVQAAYDAWDQNPCSADAANDVVRKINVLVAQYRQKLTDLRYVVPVGSDEVIPMTRIADGASISNERGYANDLAFLLGDPSDPAHQQAKALFAAEFFGFYLSDDAYTTFASTPFDGRELFLPSVSSGRLLETPREVKDQLDAYTAANGLVNPKTSVTTGYDFLTSGANAVNGALGQRLGKPNADALINDTWTRQNLRDKLVPAGAASPDIISANAHYNHYELLPAGASSSKSFASGDLLKVGDLPQRDAGSGSPAQFAGRVLFTVGCHAGLNVPDSSGDKVTADKVSRLKDWTQYYAQQQAAVYVANTGYGYGDTETLALSERLMALFAQNFNDDSLAIGEKLVLAKHAYFDSGATYDVYDSKVLEEATLYGLPFYHVAGNRTQGSPASPVTRVDPVSGLATSNVSLSPQLTATTGPRGTLWNDSLGGVAAALYRPIEPSRSLDVTVGGAIAHGAIIKGLATTDRTGVQPVLDMPAVDLGAHEPQPNIIDETFPASLVHVSRSVAFGQDRQHLVVVEGQYRGQGVQRLVNSLNVDVAYSNSTDMNPPQLGNASVTRSGNAGQVSVVASSATSTVKRVAALYNDGTGWKFAELGNNGGGTWSATMTLATAADFEVFFQALDGNGNAAYTTNKGGNFTSTLTPPGAPVSLVATGGDRSITLGWGAPTSAGVVSYRVYRGSTENDLAPYAMVAGDRTTYLDANLPSATSYTYAVAAINGGGESALSNLATARTTGASAPSEPRGVTASGTGKVGEIRLDWNSPLSDGGSPVISYRVYRSQDGSVYSRIAEVPSTSLTFTDSGLVVLSTYRYRVTAVNAVGESGGNSACGRPAPLGGILSCTT
ncbi:MAG: hypothetical protein NVSMB17_01630 [Candidatus Dormibacteria bacterium]